MKRSIVAAAVCVIAIGQFTLAGAQAPNFSMEDTLLFPRTHADTVVRGPGAPVVEKAAKKIKVQKKEFRFWEQVGLAVGMMGFILIMMTTTDAFNPD